MRHVLKEIGGLLLMTALGVVMATLIVLLIVAGLGVELI